MNVKAESSKERCSVRQRWTRRFQLFLLSGFVFVDAALTFTLTAKNGGTELVLENNVGGFMPGGFKDWGGKADHMFSQQGTRLKAYIETGSPGEAK